MSPATSHDSVGVTLFVGTAGLLMTLAIGLMGVVTALVWTTG